MSNINEALDLKSKNDLKHIRSIKHIICMMVVVLISCVIYKDASALGNLLDVNEADVYAGAVVNLRDYVDDQYLIDNFGTSYNTKYDTTILSYKWNTANQSPVCATLGSTGKLTTLTSGQVLVDVTYKYQNTTAVETITVNILAPEQIVTTYGSVCTLGAVNIYPVDTYTYSAKKDSVVVNTDGTITVQGFTDTEVYAKGSDGKSIEVAKVSISQPEYTDTIEVRALESDPYEPSLNNYCALEGDDAIKWTVGNEDVVKVVSGGIQTVTEGETTVKAQITAKNGETVKLNTTITVTNPSLTYDEVVLAAGLKKAISVNGTCENSTIDWNVGSTGKAYMIREGKIYANKKGTAVLPVVVDGRTLTCTVIVTNPYCSTDGITAYKGGKKTIKIKGLDSSKSGVTFTSKNASIAAISSDGVLKAKKTGRVKIVAKADGKKINLTVEVASKKAYKAAQKEIAISKTKTQYSQAKRMSNGFYDCSSIVWRTYSQFGCYLGVRSGWAPTAASIGYWCTKNNKVIYNKGVSYTKLLPGDLIFYSYTTNGRYKNISHIEMYVGQGKSVSASSTYNSVVHYAYKSSSVVMIARPTK